MRRAALRRLSPSLQHQSDPGLVALRRAAPTALVIPLALLFGRFVVGDPQNLIFIVFGCFALLVLADFGGALLTRSLAYLLTIMAGPVLIALGTLASATAVGAALVMLVVGFGLALLRAVLRAGPARRSGREALPGCAGRRPSSATLRRPGRR